jgi:serine phosphatase RsbU (regulator of sigma subunit)/pSer/pThr/pTyr-binding forkhead associated (FHA) protein
MPTLLFLSGSQTGTQVPIVSDRFVIGRHAACDLILTLERDSAHRPNVSRRHAILTCTDGQWFVEDGDGQGRPSRNGTTLNNQRVPYPSRVPLYHDDQITICGVRLAFQFDPSSTFTPEVAVSHADSQEVLETQSADRLRLLLDVSTALRGTLDPDAVLDRMLEHLFRMFPQTERGIFVSCEQPTGAFVVRALRTPRGEPADPRFSTTVVRHCLENLEAVLGNDLPNQFPGIESISALSARSLLLAPLWTPDGQALGAVQLDTRADNRKFTAEDLRLLLGVASQASIALSNARLHRDSLTLQRRQRDLEVAQQVQRALLPATLPDVPGYSFCTHYAAADQVGGDYYDFVPLPSGRLAVLLGDVAGHGVAAALVMARFGAEARACLESEVDPAAAVARLNALMIRAALPESFVTLAGLVLDPVTHRAAVVCAGHPSPLLRRAEGDIVDVVPHEANGLALGIDTTQKYECREILLKPGESILLFSDGVFEAMDADDRQFETARVRSVFSAAGPSPGTTIAALTDAVQRHSAGCRQADDITLVCLSRRAN